MNDEFYMGLALSEAWKFQILTYPNPAVGCLILDENGQILSCKAHEKAGYLHAEPTAILFALCKKSDKFKDDFIKAYNAKFSSKIKEGEFGLLEPKFTYEFILNNHSNLLKNAKAYVTLEPCSHHGKTPPCANLLKELGFIEVIIGSHDENKIASGGANLLKSAGVKVKFGILKERCDKLLEPFLAYQNGGFSFLKIALSKNGVASGGIITNELSRTHVHKLRSVIDTLVIGGNTVRTDRPRLDTRLVKNGKNPDVIIYSRGDKFDETLPLFGVPDRKVGIQKELDLKGLCMFEGAGEFLKLAKEGKLANVKWLLIYQGSNFKIGENLSVDLNLKPLFSGNFGDDSCTWYEILD
ncbi:riboflavin biosynthesis protein RibD [Campylobacter concisus]|uniref:Riboflavin biosynthesis protein RibD n=1 Tax=Campylobacter concisus TaxID=199 RepID=A0A1Y5NDF0_9BACT|nr:bifunctional diaminohydroxyphosphoribosylaminopyrimidine deaminase/5-amino-6-(5-phosphoribosylamino)uracil reductase RibD [Campylobacter concisus]OUT18817.1 riboflavin biosynthesis protein RibD [Campylobacter concisus]